MVATAASGSVVSGSTSTDSSVIRGSQTVSDLTIRSLIWRRVVVVFGSNRNRPNPPPKSGSRRRSRSSVRSTIWTASRTFWSPCDQATRPSAPTRGGKLIPRPRMRPGSISALRLHGDREADLEERQPPEDDVQQRDEDHQDDQRADRDDR